MAESKAVQIAVVGIDGSGKSTVSRALARLLSADMGLICGVAGERFELLAPEQDLLAAGFAPTRVPWAVRLAMLFKRWAKRLVSHLHLYPMVKLAQMLLQDHAAKHLAVRGGADAVLSDGNALLSAMGRAANYRAPAHAGGTRAAPTKADLGAVLDYLVDGAPLPGDLRARHPFLPPLGALQRLLHRLHLHAGWLPDAVVFLDVTPEQALGRIAARGQAPDPHENARDLAQARASYQAALAAVQGRGIPVVRLDGVLALGEVLSQAEASLAPLLAAAAPARTERPLGTTAGLEGPARWRKFLSPRYLAYLVRHAAAGAWAEPTFLFSRLGRLFLRQGYSAGVMRAIYRRNPARLGLWDRAFLAFPLHRAVRERLDLLRPRIAEALEAGLAAGPVRVLTAPSGFAEDLLGAAAEVLRSRPGWAGRLEVVAADLDPRGDIAPSLRRRAQTLGIRLRFLRGDLTDPAFRRALGAGGRFDLAVFVGLSCWLPKPALLEHLRWLSRQLKGRGLLVTDAFTPAAYALAGHHAGYRSNYYDPALYAALLETCGFDGAHARVASTANGINHVLVAAAQDLWPEASGLRPLIATCV